VIGPNVYEADRFATACYAMGKKGISFLDSIEGLEGYMITRDGKELLTKEFRKYL
jgi:thiamine biosynthesis lipoprotein